MARYHGKRRCRVAWVYAEQESSSESDEIMTSLIFLGFLQHGSKFFNVQVPFQIVQNFVLYQTRPMKFE
jgi:hypothetical protein